MDTSHVNKHSYLAIVLYMAVVINLVPKQNLYTKNFKVCMLLPINFIPCERKNITMREGKKNLMINILKT